MPPRKDLTGMRFGKLVVTGSIGADKWRHTQWLCKCDCGGETISSNGHALRSGDRKSCGCLKHDEAHNSFELTGKRYGRLLVLKRVMADGTKKKESHWLCRCDCGQEKVINGKNLEYGKTNSCGCLKKEFYKIHPILMRGEANPNFKTGIRINKEGYTLITCEDSKGGWKDRPFHVVVMEKHIGRFLTPGETVHHKNGIRSDNHVDNLELWSQMHPYGQRVEDMISFCSDYLSEYAPEYLASLKGGKCASAT